ncbi:DUF317 domain-containing protein [Streptomyces sp. NPDC056401]|uniref:DUF317 domain-containing protein n=1 Tax=Streptomyces sp. NPDC056401 TaxID=3345809 RepID=UPI0035D7EC99
MKQPDEQDRVLVSPRHLAGRGDRLSDVLGLLTHPFEWKHNHRPASGRVTVESPDGSTFVDFTPSGFDEPWWTVRHHEPYWKITAGRQPPLEALAAVTQALPQLLGDARHCEQIPLASRSVTEIASVNGWTTDGTSITSADGHCTLHHRPDTEQPWLVESSVYDGFDTHWFASFEGDVPDALVRQFLAHLASTDPVERTLADVPYLSRYSARITPMHGWALGPHIVHALAALPSQPSPQRSR